MKLKPKYSQFAEFLSTKREDKYRSARDFCGRVKLAVSYPQYSRYETGEQLPSLSQALAIAQELAVPTLEMILEWNLAQVPPTEEADAMKQLEGLLVSVRSGKSVVSEPESAKSKLPLDEVIVFNRSHRELFLKDPAYRDIFSFVNAFTSPHSTGLSEISETLSIARKDLLPMMENLVKLGVILQEGTQYLAAKRNFYFPDDQDFFELRHRNLRHNVDTLLETIRYKDLAEKRAFRTLLTREMTHAQMGWVIGQLEAVLGKIVDLPEDPTARTIYSFCAVLGERFTLPPSSL
jgi:transcriptional regulator with XRE-family HTH domain